MLAEPGRAPVDPKRRAVEPWHRSLLFHRPELSVVDLDDRAPGLHVRVCHDLVDPIDPAHGDLVLDADGLDLLGREGRTPLGDDVVDLVAVRRASTE